MIKTHLFMNKIAHTRVLYAGLLLVLSGACCLWAENRFYQYIDNDGMLHESLLLPVGVFSLLLGFAALFLFTTLKIMAMIKARR